MPHKNGDSWFWLTNQHDLNREQVVRFFIIRLLQKDNRARAKNREWTELRKTKGAFPRALY